MMYFKLYVKVSIINILDDVLKMYQDDIKKLNISYAQANNFIMFINHFTPENNASKLKHNIIMLIGRYEQNFKYCYYSTF